MNRTKRPDMVSGSSRGGSIGPNSDAGAFISSLSGASAARSGGGGGNEHNNLTEIPPVLPHERVFPIQIGGELFKLSGASLSSDAPSYFSQYFLLQISNAEENGADVNGAIKTLYIDRDPLTFRDIALHLQGYHVSPRDGTHFVRLFADAQFYSLPRLISRLYDESIFISIGHREFQIPRNIFSDPGNSPNYFSLGFAAFFSGPDDLFPGLDREGLIRPPSIMPPSVPNRSADTFAELLQMLRGYPLTIRDENHRTQLLRDARYFHFKGLEQRLVHHFKSFNQARGRDEIVLRLENVQKSGVGASKPREENGAEPTSGGWVTYARPFVDEKPAELVLEVGGEATKLHFFDDGTVRAEFYRDTKARITRLFEVIATKLGLPGVGQPLGAMMAAAAASGGAANSQPPASPGNTPLSEDLVRVVLGPESAILLDGEEYSPVDQSGATPIMPNFAGDHASLAGPGQQQHSRKRRRTMDGPAREWIVKTGQWRLRLQPVTGGKSSMECSFVAVKLDATASEYGRNMKRAFLSS